MPGKVNPVIPEVVTQVAAQVIGNDAAISIGGMQGHFELNVFVPLMARNLLQSIKLLASASRLLDTKCVAGIEANLEQTERYAEATLSAATALNPYIGYDKATEIVKEAAASGRSLREVAREAGRRRRGARRGARLPQDGSPARLISQRFAPMRVRDIELLLRPACLGRARIGSCFACRRNFGSACTTRPRHPAVASTARSSSGSRAVWRTSGSRRQPTRERHIVRNLTDAEDGRRPRA